MAFTTLIEGRLPDGSRTSAPDFWNVSHDVYPNAGVVTTDVMLLQGLLIAYFLGPAVPPAGRAKALAILRSSRGRFDDGIYGPKTREVMRLFEDDIRAPYRDGIVRTVWYFEGNTKLEKLNFNWNMTMLGGALGDTKKESGRRALHPTLVAELYGT